MLTGSLDTMNNQLLQQLENKIVGLQTTIDRVTTEKWDLEECSKRLEMKLAQVSSQLDGAHQTQQRLQSGHNEELFRTRRTVEAAEKEQKRLQDNHIHALQTIEQQGRTLVLAQKEMDRLRNQHIAEEHFARKLVQMCDENTKLVTEIQTLKQREKDALEILAKREEPSDEVRKYQEQVTRLLKERVDFDCQLTGTGEQGSFCGGCLACQLKQARQILEQTSKNLEARNVELAQTKAVVVQTAANVKDRNDKIYALENALLSRSNDADKALAEQRVMILSKDTEIGHLKNLLRLMRDALTDIMEEGFWNCKTIAKTALQARLQYMDDNKIKENW